MHEIETARVRLRALDAADRAAFQRICADPEVMRHVEPPLAPAHAARRFEQVLVRTHRARDRLPSFALLDKREDRLLGFGGVAQFDRASGRAEVGMLLDGVAQRRGLGTEILAALIDAAFAALPLAEVWVQYRDGHSAAAALVRRVGLDLQHDRAYGSGNTRCHVAAVDRESWLRRRQSTNKESV